MYRIGVQKYVSLKYLSSYFSFTPEQGITSTVWICLALKSLILTLKVEINNIFDAMDKYVKSSLFLDSMQLKQIPKPIMNLHSISIMKSAINSSMAVDEGKIFFLHYFDIVNDTQMFKGDFWAPVFEWTVVKYVTVTWNLLTILSVPLSFNIVLYHNTKHRK